VASGTLGLAPGRVGTERDMPDPVGPEWTYPRQVPLPGNCSAGGQHTPGLIADIDAGAYTDAA